MKKLNLGCGEFKKEGYINLDWQSLVKPDVAHDLNKFPYPFEDNHFDLIEADHILEHLDKVFDVMKELRRLLKPGGKLIIRVPHFSRGFTHVEHVHGFDITFPLYFDKNFTKSGYFGIDFQLERMKLKWLASFHLLPYVGINKGLVVILRFFNTIVSFLANLSPKLCSRFWCYWLGGFEEIEFYFICKK